MSQEWTCWYTLDLLKIFMPNNLTGEKFSVPKWVTALFLILDHMLQWKIQLTIYAHMTGVMGGTSLVSNSEDTNLAGAGVGAVDNSKNPSRSKSVV